MKTLTTLLSILLFTSSIFAVPFLVNSNGDTNDADTTDSLCLDSNGNCTLRAAVEQANALPSSDEITFTDQVSLITLNSDILIDSRTSTLSVIGRGPLLLTVDAGAGINRIFQINGNSLSFSNNPVTISGMTITGGNVPGFGGGILSRNTPLTLDFVHITGNVGASGGGVY